MSNKTIHELDSLSEIAQNDEMLIYDISAGADNPTKKTTVGTIKNYMADNIKDVYSTDEVKTNKVWIDGKPIYRKVVEITSPAYDWTPMDLTSLFPNLDKAFLGKMCRISRQDGSIICQNGFYYADTDGCEFTVAEYANNLRICCFLKSTAQITNIAFEVEYTKTTD